MHRHLDEELDKVNGYHRFAWVDILRFLQYFRQLRMNYHLYLLLKYIKFNSYGDTIDHKTSSQRNIAITTGSKVVLTVVPKISKILTL